MVIRRYKVSAAFKSKLLHQWVFATFYGRILFCLMFAHQAGMDGSLFLNNDFFSWYVIPLVGAGMGVFQHLVLEKKFRCSYWWVVATSLGLAFSLPLCVPLFGLAEAYLKTFHYYQRPIFFLTYCVFCQGLSLGIAQTFFFLNRVSGAWNWIVFRALADSCFGLALVLLYPALRGIVDASSSAPGVGAFYFLPTVLGISIVWSAIEGPITGILLFDFVSRQETS